jgi:RNA polymerase sigma factor (sigma-70 family)
LHAHVEGAAAESGFPDRAVDTINRPSFREGLMATATLGTVLRHLHHLGPTRAGEDVSDGQLLDRFRRGRDEAAFALLLRRHGPAVLGVCRRVLRHEQDADDAFQATFLVLVRHADSVRATDSLASWLYAVALRTARRAKLDAARRRTREQRAAAMPTQQTPAEHDCRELRALLDEEIAALPEKYRAPLVLCHLEGRTNAEAARALRLPLGSLSKLLARARGLLRGRLLRRGVALSAAGLIALLAGQAGAVPPALARATLATALGGLTGAAVAAQVAALADGVTRTLFAGKLKTRLLGLAVLALLAGGGWFALGQQTAGAPGGEAPKQHPAAAEKDPPRDKEPPRPDRMQLDEVKGRLLRRNGGSDKSEAAVAAGLAWLVKQQQEDGHWALDGPAMKNDTAGTAFGLLPLLGAGHAHADEKGPFAKNVRRGLDFLIDKQGKDGDLGGGTYAHALATVALCDAFALTGDPKLKAPAERALDYIVRGQHKQGGWRYAPRTEGDLSVTVWMVEALHAGRAAGLDVPPKTLDDALKFVALCADGRGGYTYLPGVGTASPTMTAAGLLAGSRLGTGTRDENFIAGTEALTKVPADKAESLYYLNFAAPALRQRGDVWEEWNAGVRDTLVEKQEAAGSWPAKGDPYALAGGRVMSTSLALMTLEVYYRDDLRLAAPPRELEAKEVEAVWSDLAGDDPVKVRRGVWALSGSPKAALPLLKEALTPKTLPDADERRVARLIAELDDDSFDVREKASAELEKVGTGAAAAMREALEKAPSAESRRRLEALLGKIDRGAAPEQGRALRAVEVLENVGTPEARRLLEALAKNSPHAELARAAKAALGRLDEKP